MNGRPGDHPLTDIVLHRLPTFSPEADALIREIVALGGREELEGAVRLFDPPPLPELVRVLRDMRDRLRGEGGD